MLEALGLESTLMGKKTLQLLITWRTVVLALLLRKSLSSRWCLRSRKRRFKRVFRFIILVLGVSYRSYLVCFSPALSFCPFGLFLPFFCCFFSLWVWLLSSFLLCFYRLRRFWFLSPLSICFSFCYHIYIYLACCSWFTICFAFA